MITTPTIRFTPRLRHPSSRLGLALLSAASVAAVAMPCTPSADAATTKCYSIGQSQEERTIPKSSLLPEQLGFKSLTTRHNYEVILKGKQDAPWSPFGEDVQHFKPTHFLIRGRGTALAGANPAGAALGSRTEIRIRSRKTNASYGLSLPAGVSVSWDSARKTKSLVGTHFENTATRADSMVVGDQNPIVGAADRDTGLETISVTNAVIAKGGTGPYFGPTKSWSFWTEYVSEPGGTDLGHGLSPRSCSGLAWNNAVGYDKPEDDTAVQPPPAPVNQRPVATDQRLTVYRNQWANGTQLNAHDPEKAGLTYRLISQSFAQASFPTFKFDQPFAIKIPATATYGGTIHFTYEVRDPQGLTDTAQVTMDIR